MLVVCLVGPVVLLLFVSSGWASAHSQQPTHIHTHIYDKCTQEEIQRILEQNRGDGPVPPPGAGGHHKPVGKLATAAA
jgi:hypothetical protein